MPLFIPLRLNLSDDEYNSGESGNNLCYHCNWNKTFF